MLHEVSFNLFGKPRNIKFDINSIADAEREVKTGIMSLFQQERLGIDIIRIMLWAGLKHEDSTLSIKKVGEMMQNYIEEKDNIAEVMDELTQKIMEGLEESGIFGKKKEKKQGENQAGEAEK